MCQLQEGMLQKFTCSWSFVNIHFEAEIQKVFETRTEFVELLYFRCSIGFDQFHRTSLTLIIHIRRRTFNHFDGCDAQGPYIYFGAVWFVRHHFRSHPKWRAYQSPTFRSFWWDLSTTTEIGQFHVTVEAQKDIVTFDVSVNAKNRINKNILIK